MSDPCLPEAIRTHLGESLGPAELTPVTGLTSSSSPSWVPEHRRLKMRSPPCSMRRCRPLLSRSMLLHSDSASINSACGTSSQRPGFASVAQQLSSCQKLRTPASQIPESHHPSSGGKLASQMVPWTLEVAHLSCPPFSYFFP